MDQARSKTPLLFFVAVLILSFIAVFLLVSKCTSDTPAVDDNSSSTAHNPAKQNNGSDSITLTPGGKHVDDINTGHDSNPEDLIGQISEVTIRANDTGDIQPLLALLGKQTLTPAQTKHLRELASTSRLKLDQTTPFSSIQGLADKWSLNLADRNRIYLDLTKTADGKWQVNSITLPTNKGSITENSIQPNDPANPDEERKAAAAVHNFLTSIIKLDPASARKHIDSTKVSYARLAGLCIIFEEGKYHLIKDKALRKKFLRNTTAGWIARVEAPDNGQAAMFAINTKRKDAQSPWKITEINLDQLLADYANRVSGGDIHYTPLIKNPKGGDALVIYFDLNSNELTARTQRQLSIVANLLKTDPEKKLTISGHTDALGSDEYNLTLSEKRARQVMRFLTQSGVTATQMDIASFGKAKPRVPNVAKDGSDAPDGRRVNRRAEILLDF
jgi:OOP family OmpA-OmpF porin